MNVKVCGLCSVEDARMADELGADYAGMILSPNFRRSRTFREAQRISDGIMMAQRVGVFVDASMPEIQRARRELALDVLQLHGNESVDTVRALRDSTGAVIWKAVRPRTADELMRALESYAPVVHGVLLDAWSLAAPGGTGAQADWSMAMRLRDILPSNVMFALAGGLQPSNVADAIAAVRPDVVDVSSGVESAVGVKERALVHAFLAAARAAA